MNELACQIWQYEENLPSYGLRFCLWKNCLNYVKNSPSNSLRKNPTPQLYRPSYQILTVGILLLKREDIEGTHHGVQSGRADLRHDPIVNSNPFLQVSGEISVI